MRLPGFKRLKRFGRALGTVLLLLAALAVAAALGPAVVTTMTPDRLSAADDLIARIWWPATALRVAVYVLLAWGVYPLWVGGHHRAARARRGRLPPRGEDPAADWDRMAWDARLDQLARAARRQPRVFGLFLAGDLVLAQFPYWLLRG